MDYDIVDPDPAALIESLRAFGYTTSTAIADLIDNSITARARNGRVTFFSDRPPAWIRRDDHRVGVSEAPGRTIVLTVFTVNHFGSGEALENAIGLVAKEVADYFDYHQ